VDFFAGLFFAVDFFAGLFFAVDFFAGLFFGVFARVAMVVRIITWKERAGTRAPAHDCPTGPGME
jgi:hypothetical protein